MRLFLHEFRTQQLLFWRTRELAFFTFLLPVMFFLIFGAIYGNDVMKQEGDVKASWFLEAGMIGFGVASTCFAGLGISMVVRRESGVLKRIRSTPLAPSEYVVGVLASTFFVFLIQSALIVLIGRLVFSVPIPARLPSLLAVLAIGAVSFAAMGLGITGFVHSAEGSSAVINAIYLPMSIISGTFFTPKAYPGFLKAIAAVLPLTYYTRMTRDVILHGAYVWNELGAIAVVLAWGAVGLLAALRRFRWEPVEAT